LLQTPFCTGENAMGALIYTIVGALIIFVVLEFALKFFKVKASLAHTIAVVAAVVWLLGHFL
jgi:hypothetical protein